MKARSLLALILVCAMTLVGAFAVVAALQQRQSIGCDPSGPALTVDPNSLPAGTVAGLSREQLGIAATVMVAAQQRGMSARDQQIGVMVAIGESDLTNVNYGDAAGPDSRGVFQQRDNGAWGSLSDRMNPSIAAGRFFDALKRVTDRDSLAPTIAAHRVQRNADPNHYAVFWDKAGAITTFLAGVRPASTAPAPQASSAGSAAGNPYGLTKVLPGAITVANTVGPKFGLKTIGGWRPTDRFPDHPGGYALDLMVPVGDPLGDRVAAYLMANAATLHVDYIIWKQRSWNPRRGTWKAMPDRGSITANHFDHVHLTIDKEWAAGTSGDLAPLAEANCALPANHTQAVTAQGWASPAKGPVTSGFGPRSSPGGVGSTWHKGIDIGAGCGEPIYAAQAGTVSFAGPASGYGNVIRITHTGGLETVYGHMPAASITVRSGEKVTGGRQIAKIGTEGASTGCHLHFEVKQSGRAVDPQAYLKQAGVTVGDR